MSQRVWVHHELPGKAKMGFYSVIDQVDGKALFSVMYLVDQPADSKLKNCTRELAEEQASTFIQQHPDMRRVQPSKAK